MKAADAMEAEWKKAIQRFLLNNLGQMEQDEVDAWLKGELELAPLLEPPLRALYEHKGRIMAELHQISPAEIFDRFQLEHPELSFPNRNQAVVRMGRELEALKAFIGTL
ncbi:MAG: hypothetical protein JSU93_01570 [Methanobacteriota archaeon]|nr:MAG: hypothetical protein JSU93_01570 [Euryarchaeota archaeon]